jgi:hypothetical protein
MTCGTVLSDKNFQFSNGKSSPKLLIVLCEFGTNYLILVTTSQPHSKGKKSGCQNKDKPPNYFLPKGSCWFDDDTWVQLDEVVELDSTIQGYKKKDGTVVEYKDVLPTALMKHILDCALESEFIEEFYLDFLRKVRDKL